MLLAIIERAVINLFLISLLLFDESTVAAIKSPSAYFSSDSTVRVGFLALSAVRRCLTDHGVILDTFYYIPHTLNTVLRNSTNSTRCGHKKASVWANKDSVWVYT